MMANNLSRTFGVKKSPIDDRNILLATRFAGTKLGLKGQSHEIFRVIL
jgi:hypothetical protein